MRTPPSHRRGLTVAVCVLVALTATGPVASAGTRISPTPATASSGLAAPSAARPDAAGTVTLITGDKVAVTVGSGGTTATVTDAQGRPGGAHVMTVGPDTYVYPDAALPWIASGALDERLFNVSELLKDGYDDAHSDRLPLIVTYTDAAARARSAQTPDGARKTLTLSSIQGAAISAEHARASDFWSSSRAPPPRARRVPSPPAG